MSEEYIEREALMRAITCRKVNEMLRSDLTAQMIDGKNPDAWLKGFDCGMQQALDIIDATHDPKVVIEVDKFASKIAGHSYYHGDKILARLYCLKEGQEIEESIEPADVVEVVHGEWIIIDNTEYYVEAKCSVCGAEGMFSHHQRKPKRCSECGAHMDRYIHVFNMGGYESKWDETKKKASPKDKSRCRKCVYEMTCFKDRDFEGTCPKYKLNEAFQMMDIMVKEG